MKLEYLISDCDGVIVDTEYLAAFVMVDYLKEFGVDISVDYYFNTWSGTTFSGILNHYSNERGFKLPEGYIEEISNRFEKAVDGELRPIQDIKEAYTSVPLTKAVVSNSYKFQVEHSIKLADVDSLFEDRIFSSDMVENPKPAPDLYLYAMDKIGATTENSIVVEDSISGAKAALAAGLTVIGFVGARHIQKGHDEKLRALGVKYIIDKMKDLPPLIEQIQKGEEVLEA
ncbi:HAD family hydrolase [Sediminitomix flava]|uniref:HAD superfamily hydrolase (TIGR01509 family) n=1 Tax=Sediminitomix flava TaxID=379075 RepID=A0A315Z8A5_SEDFL|nr:HAD-IA family hydrolase [Sediminitomix flava]PWJ40155.1 HAD superfamily hydrolase (TIGR01509 family) [Sediminitomix flava]